MLKSNKKPFKPNILLPFYSISEEIASSISHGIGAYLSVAALVLMLMKTTGTLSIIAVVVYGVSLILLFTASTLYHAVTAERAKKVLRVCDHSMVFLLIAGTYTPYTLISLRGAVGYVIFALVWATTIVGIVLKFIDMERFKKVTMACCVASGWCIVAAMIPLVKSLAVPGIVLLIVGGVFYTAGLYFYKQKKVKYMHFVWHLFVLAGAIVHFFSIYLYVI